MRPTDILSNEHRVIEQVLSCLEKMVQECGAGAAIDADSARDAIEFFRNFADRCHHGKEEAHLFPAMEAKGFSREFGPTGVMISEHELGRMHVRGMAESLDRAAAGDEAAVKEFCDHARHYAALLRQHIEKEDHCLFSMANQAFTEEDQRELLAKFQRVESEEMGEGTHERFLAVANALADRYGVAPTEAAKHHACGCAH